MIIQRSTDIGLPSSALRFLQYMHALTVHAGVNRATLLMTKESSQRASARSWGVAAAGFCEKSMFCETVCFADAAARLHCVPCNQLIATVLGPSS